MLSSLTFFSFALRNTSADSHGNCDSVVPCEILTIITAVHKCVSITPADVLKATFGYLLLVQSFRALKPLYLPTPSAKSQATVTAQEIPGTSISFHRQRVDPHLPCDCLLTISMNNNKKPLPCQETGVVHYGCYNRWWRRHSCCLLQDLQSLPLPTSL